MTHRTPHGSGAKGPDELRQQIERTRSRLGDTVAQLMGRADVTSRALARAADVRDKAGAMTVQLRAAGTGHAVQDGVAKAGHVVQGTATRAGHAVRGGAARAGHAAQSTVAQAGHAVQGAGHVVEQHAPQPVRSLTRAALRHPRPLMAVGAAGAAVVTMGVLRHRHH
ncbi:DUF3618 domain-containing protein [Streptomyces sp. MUM 16J]|uniref:DUF3618 domain-containing protein n=1 Tax=Streptomyces sp. MUM 16J TaxID=2791988 RepID=UPI001F03B554|nr:DUF3618 domain-containing protein [Streptomyces sp. MUM 16J]MCH0558602.1 DUF3618 domain-containing protein [Streptomyces sp. MUM 16J]